MTLPEDFQVHARCFARDLKAAERKPKTVKVYTDGLALFGTYLDTLPDEPEIELGKVVVPGAVESLSEDVTRDHIKGWLAWLQDRTSQRDGQPLSKGYRNNLYRALQAFWKWMVVEGHCDYNPMANLDAPKADEVPVPVVTVEQLKALVATCGKGKKRSFIDIRDEAILRILLDTGIRISELLVDLDAVDLRHQTIMVKGKGGRSRQVSYLDSTASAVDRYEMARRKHPKAKGSNALWIGRWGPMSSSGLYQAVVRRGQMIDLPLHPHQFRHTAAHQHTLRGGTETSLMRLMGWRSSDMAKRYGASAADERARNEHTNIAFGDTI